MNASPKSDRPVPAFLPRWLAPAHQRIAAAVERLPVEPPSFAAARLLDRGLLPRLPADARQALLGRDVELVVSDFGWRVRLRLGPQGFGAARDVGTAAVRISAPLQSHFLLLRGDEDPDRLFFERRLVIEGDTELGLVLKNTLDAIGPLWPRKAPVSAPRGRREARTA